jgi:hypothetical protein
VLIVKNLVLASAGADHPDPVGVNSVHRHEVERTATGRKNGGEDGLELSKAMVARELMLVKSNLLVIRMGVAGLTQWGSSWWGERVCGRGGVRKNCGNLWKGVGGSTLEIGCWMWFAHANCVRLSL